jgi:hypothetical protein
MIQCFLLGHCDGPPLNEARGAISDAGPTRRNGTLQTSRCAIRHEAMANEGKAGPPQGVIWSIVLSVIVTPGSQCSCA